VQAVAGKTYTATFCSVGQYRAEYFQHGARRASGLHPLRGRGPLQTGDARAGHDLPRDNLSVRWTGRFIFGEGPGTFRTLSDHGLHFFVDGALVIGNEHSATALDATRALSAGEHEVRVEYFEAGGEAVARVSC
jgi:hypothetical protein